MAVTWTDIPITANVTHIRKIHIDEIRNYIYNHMNVGSTEAGGHPEATSSSPGFMSASDKQLLQSVSATAGSILSVAGSGAINVTPGNAPTISILPATTSTNGALIASDKAKLDAMVNIPDRVTALEAKPGTGTVTSVTFTNPGITVSTPSTIPTITIQSASATGAGLMTETQSSKLDTMDSFPIGSIIMWHGDLTAYNDLFTAAGLGKEAGRFNKWKVLYGSYNESPFDMRDKFALGAASPENTTRKSGTTTFNLNGTEAEGETAHKLTVAELASHKHNFANILASVGGLSPQVNGIGQWGNQDTLNTGGDVPHNNMPPFVRLYYVYKYAI